MGEKGSSGLPAMKRSIKRHRTKITLMAYLWKIVLTIMIPSAIFGVDCVKGLCIDVFYFQQRNATLNLVVGNTELLDGQDFFGCDQFLPFIVMAVNVACSVVCYKVGKAACKVVAQEAGFSLPLLLSTPVTVGVFVYLFHYPVSVAGTACNPPFPRFVDDWSLGDIDNSWAILVAGVLGFVSYVFITNYIWIPGSERMQKTEKYVNITSIRILS
jgi:hypothetical protein